MRKSAYTSPIKRVGLILVFALVAFLFWKNYERVFERIRYQKIVEDEVHGLTKDQKEIIRKFAKIMKSEYGIVLKIKIYKDHIKPPRITVKTLFIGISPKRKEYIIIFPPLLKKAFSEQFVDYLKNKHFILYIQKNEWQKGLMKCLLLIWENLSK